MNDYYHPPHPIKKVRQRSPKARYLSTVNMYLYRSRMRLTQTDLARLVESDRKTIYNIERGRVVPSVIMAIKIAKVLGHPVEAVFKVSPRPVPSFRPL